MKQKQLTVKTLFEQGIAYLRKHSVDHPEIDAKWLLLDHLNMTDLDYILGQNIEIDINSAKAYMSIIERRAAGEPVQYICGYQEFMGLTFKVNPNVLIPRQDTETLVELILNNNDIANGKIMDIGTGSGCISISLLKSHKDWTGLAIDISEGALNIAKENAKLNNVLDRLEFILSDLFDNLGEKDYNMFDIIISNPPYIPKNDVNELMTEVRDHEPHLALDGGYDGLDFYRVITKEAKKFLKDEGYLYFEVGIHQSNEVKELMIKNGYHNIEVIKDLAGIPRIVYGII